MYKTLLTLSIYLSIGLSSSVVLAGTCVGGKEFTAKNGHEFCVSSTGMTWWAANVWCKNQGRELATLNQACNNFIGSGNTSCPNVENAPQAAIWTATLASATGAYHINPYNSAFSAWSRNSEAVAALCY